MSFFKSIALPLAARGIPVIPVRGKRPFLTDFPKLATTNSAQIDDWDTQYPDCNVGCVALAQEGGYWFLDQDDPNLMATIERTSGHKFPNTLTVGTRRGVHAYFLHNARSIAMGNLAGEGGEARCHNQQVVGPGSLHPVSGHPYKIINNAPIVEAAEWLIAWLERNWKTKSRPSAPHTPPTNGEAQADLDLKINLVSKVVAWDAAHDQKVQVLSEGLLPYCAPNGVEGLKLHLRCFNWERHSDYPAEPAYGSCSLLLAPGMGIDYKCQHAHCKDLDWAYFKRHIGYNTDDEVCQAMAKFGAVTAQVIEKHTQKKKEKANWEFPTACLYGKLGEYTRELECPLGMAYVSMLTAFASKGVPQTGIVRPTLYAVTVAEVHRGKSVVMKRAIAKMGVIMETGTPASSRGLQKKYAESNGATSGIYLDEILTLFQNLAIHGSGSSLASTLNTLWSEDEAAGSWDKTGAHEPARVRLNILGGLPIKTPDGFREAFSRTTTSGFYDRCVLGVFDRGERFKPPTSPLPSPVFVIPSSVQVPAAMMDRAWRWAEKDINFRGRLQEIMLRVAVITASANGDSVVTDECFEAAKKFTEWQENIRLYYAPSEAANDSGKCVEAVVAGFKQLKGKSIMWSKIARSKGWYTTYGTVLGVVKQMLLRDGVLFQDEETGVIWMEEESEHE